MIEEILETIRSEYRAKIDSLKSDMVFKMKKAEEAYYRERYPELGNVLVDRVSRSDRAHRYGWTSYIVTRRMEDERPSVQMWFKADQYLNPQVEWSDTPTPDVMKIFVDLVYRYEEHVHSDHAYLYRVTQGVFIQAWKRYKGVYSPEEVLELLKLSDNYPVERNGAGREDRQRQGFRAYLLTRSYVCQDGGDVSGWKHEREFRRLLDNYQPAQ